jgi:DNA adenine methylase
VTLAARFYGKIERAVINDLNAPLMRLWEQIIDRPEDTAKAYEQLWKAQHGREREFYDVVRDRFNKSQDPADFLYLLARCVKAAVRYNSRGEFNQSPDNRRLGTRPATMRRNILEASRLLNKRTTVSAADYQLILDDCSPEDIVYMDPPYQGVSGNRDQRYLMGLGFNDYRQALATLNSRNISYIVSYDGRREEIRYGNSFPSELELTALEVDAGRSSQATLLGRSETTFEALYLSPALVARLS